MSDKLRKERNEYIDIMKGLLICLVVMGHLVQFFEYNSRTLTLIYSFHMPAFLIIAGYLSRVNEHTTISRILKKRICGNLIPYFVFYIISIIIFPHPNFSDKLSCIPMMFKGIGVPPDTQVNLPLWFLTYYFVAMVIFETIECLFTKFKVLLFGLNDNGKNQKKVFIETYVLIAISMIMAWAYYYSRILKAPRLPFNFEIACFTLLFVYFGKILSLVAPKFIKQIKKERVARIITWVSSIIILALTFTVWYLLSMKNGRIDFNARDYKNALFMYIDAILGFTLLAAVAFFVYLVPFIDKIFSHLGKNSMYIFAYHLPAAYFIHNLIIPRMGAMFISFISVNSIPAVLILTSSEVLLSLLFGMIHTYISNLIFIRK